MGAKRLDLVAHKAANPIRGKQGMAQKAKAMAIYEQLRATRKHWQIQYGPYRGQSFTPANLQTFPGWAWGYISDKSGSVLREIRMSEIDEIFEMERG